MTPPPASPDGNVRHLPVLLLLFVGSGCAALIYEVVWFQLLGTVVGSSAVSLGVLLGTFMGGMCLGSLLLPRLVGAAAHPLRVYAGLEFGIGVCGLALLHGMPLVADAYVAATGHGLLGRAVVATVCLLPPTFLMGATLPAVARWVRTTPSGVAWLGWFYGGNIAGAVLGSLLAGFVLLRLYDTERATYAAAALNAMVALVALALARRAGHTAPVDESRAPERAPGAAVVYGVIAVSGMTALSAEVVWTRLLALLFGGSVYTFAMILAVYLTGLGIGSAAGAAIARRAASPRAVLGVCQLLISVALAWAAYLLHASLPFWPINPSIADDPWLVFQLDAMRAMWVVVPGAVLWGASFPLALAAVARPGQDPGRLVGGVYAANTVGAIVGSLGAALIFVVWLGSQGTQQVLIVVSAVAGIVALAPPLLRRARTVAARVALRASLLAGAAVAVLLAVSVAPLPGLLVAHGRYAATWVGMTEVISVGEGLTAFVAVTEQDDGVRSYHNSGKIQASSLPEDMGLQRLLGHLTHLIPATPADVLVVGLGAGVTAGSVTLAPNVETVTIAEIEPLVPEVVAEWFSEHNDDVVNSPKVTIHLDDARHYLLTTDRKFDCITSDPLDPWVKGAATLYTREFFDEMKRHLNPGGVVTVFVQLYEANDAAVKSEIRTFFESFPHAAVFGNLRDGEGYDVVLVGSPDPLTIDLDAIQVKLLDPAYAAVAESLSEIGIHSAVELCANYAGRPEDLQAWLSDAALNRDGDLRVQYLAGMSLNLHEAHRIYAEMITGTPFPDGLFTGTAARLAALRARIERARQ